jgi:hypothetical protein
VPETFDPVTLQNDTGVKLNAAYFNRLETNLEVIDDRLAARELRIDTPVTVTYSASVTINAALGSLFRIVATGNIALQPPANGSNGQLITVQIQAASADRTLNFPGTSFSPVLIPTGQWWSGEFRYNALSVEWVLNDGAAVGSSTRVHAVGNSGAALTIDASSAEGWIKTITLSANCTVTLAGAVSGQATMLELVLAQDATGGRTVTWPVAVKWPNDEAPTLSTTAGAIDRVVLTSYNGGTTWLGDLVGLNYA